MLITIMDTLIEGYTENNNNKNNNIKLATTKTFISIPETSSSFPLIINSSRQNNNNLMDNNINDNNDQEEAGCTNSHIISAETIISFTENMDAVMISALMHILCWIGLIVSSLSLVFLNLDKLIFFRFPLRYSTCFTRARAIYLALGCWFLSTAFVLFAWSTESFHCVDEDCVTLAIFPNRLYIYLPFMICVGVIPTITSLSVAIYIMKVVSEHRRQIKAQEHLLRTPRDTNSPALVTESSPRPHSAMRSKMRTFYFIFMTTVFTAFTLLPYRFAGLQRSLNPQRTNECMTIFLYWLMMYLVYLNSMLNPLLTVSILPQYRMGFVRDVLLCQSLRAKRRMTDQRRNYYTTVVQRGSSDAAI
uniref:G_PROTEIN_RECEP_F1_2 domain-containing protein n=1 Tax=Meloidogyne hapla TaxID=6305 RepID=A0A1I8BNZ8_MELHA